MIIIWFSYKKSDTMTVMINTRGNELRANGY